jgi:hypothetical protein
VGASFVVERTNGENHVRFIAACDNLDTSKGFDIMSLFRDVFNEWYVADTSKKIRAVKRLNAEKGKHAAKPPYGYFTKDDDNSIMLIDEAVADYVREIFKRIVSGDGATVIAKDFNKRCIVSPSIHWRIRRDKDISGMDTRWFAHTVTTIMKNPSYVGTLVSQKRTTASYKNHKSYTRPKEEWVIIENHHPAIIEKETYNVVQQLLERRRKPMKTGDYGVLNGLIKCADCGSPLRINRNRNHFYYTCSLYSNSVHKFDTKCTRHSIKRASIEEIVFQKICEAVADARENKEAFAERVRKSSNNDNEKVLKNKTAELAKAERRIADLEKIIARVYEDNVSGRISNERCDKFLANYETEQTELISMAAVLKSEIESINAKRVNIDSFMEIVNKHREITELTPELARELIKKIVVYEPIRPEGKPRLIISQKVIVKFHHIGEYNPE